MTAYQIQLATDEASIMAFMEKAQANMTPPDFKPLGAFIYNDNAELIAGVYGFLTPVWLYVDTLWVDETQRGQKWGRRLMDALEQAALDQGVTQAFLGTADFQAREFYEKSDYEVTASYRQLGTHTNYIMEKQLTVSANLDTSIQVDNPPTDEAVEALQTKLHEFNTAHVGESQPESLFIVAHDDVNEVVGGVQLSVMPYDAYVGLVWIDENLKDSSLVQDLVTQVEDVVREREVSHFIYRSDDTYLVEQFKAHGYAEVGLVNQFPHDKATVMLEK